MLVVVVVGGKGGGVSISFMSSSVKWIFLGLLQASCLRSSSDALHSFRRRIKDVQETLSLHQTAFQIVYIKVKKNNKKLNEL